MAQHLISKNNLLKNTDSKNLMNISDEYSFHNDSEFREELQRYLGEGIVQNSHRLMSDVIYDLGEPKDLILSVNVDDLLERAFQEKHRKMLSVAKRSEDIYTGGNKVYLKLHGCVTEIGKAVFTTKDYLTIEENNRLFDKLKTLFAERSIIFIGFGMADIDVLRMLYRVRPQDGFSKPHYWVVPKSKDWSVDRERYYLREFNINHINMTSEDFLQLIYDHLKKKEAKEILISNLNTEGYKAPMTETKIRALIDMVDTLSLDLQGKLFFQCIKMDKGNLSKLLHQNLGSIESSLKCIFEMLDHKPDSIVDISAEDIPVNAYSLDNLKTVLKSKCPNNTPFIAHLLSKLDLQQDEELISFLFSNLSAEQVNHKIASLLLNNEVPALLGLMQNNNSEVLEKLIAYKSERFPFSHDILELLKLRVRQINGGFFDRITAITDKYKGIAEILNKRNDDLKERSNSIWDHTYCDHLNSSNTKFKIPKKFSSISSINANEINSNRVLIGQGFILFNSASKATIYELSQEKQCDLPENQFITISKDKIIICNESLVYIFEPDGSLIQAEVLDDSVAVSPKTFNHSVYFIDVTGKLYIYDLMMNEFVVKEQIEIGMEHVVDFIIYSEHLIVATEKTIIIKVVEEGVRRISLESRIDTLIGGSNDFYIASSQGIGRYDFNATLLSKYNFIAPPSTNIVFIDECKIAFGYQNRVITIVLKEFTAEQYNVVELSSEILDLIVCDGIVTVICANGEVINIDDGQIAKIEIDPINYKQASLSVGSGVLCIASLDKLVVCKISA